MKKKLSVVLVIAMILSLTACGTKESVPDTIAQEQEAVENDTPETNLAEGAVSEGGVNIVAGVREDFGGLEPYGTPSGGKIYWRPAVYETLCYAGSYGGELVNCLAKTITPVSETCWDVEIFDYIYDSEGNHITAEDVVFSYNYAKECGTVIKMANLANIEATGEYTFRLETSNINIGTYEDIFTRVIIVDQEAFEADGTGFAAKSCGTGPYVISSYTSGASLVLSKRDYWQTEESLIAPCQVANADEIKFMLIADPAQLAIAMETGEIDTIVYLNGANVNYFIDDDGNALDGYIVSQLSDPLVYNLFPNMDTNSMFRDNLALRQAIYYAIDTQGLVDGAFDGKAEALSTYGSELYSDFQEKWKTEDYFGYDPEKAKELIASSGFDTSQTIRLMTQNASPWKEIAEIVQGYLLQVGLNVEILAYDGALYAEYKNDSTQWDLKVSMDKSPDVFPNIWGFAFNSKNFENYGTNFIDDPVLQEKLATVSNSKTYTQEAVNDMHYYLKDNAYVYGMVGPVSYSIASDEKFNSTYWGGVGLPLIWASDFK